MLRSLQEARVTRPPVEARRAAPADLDDLVMLWSQAREELGRTVRPPTALPPDQVRARLDEAMSGTEVILVIGRYEGTACGYAVLRLTPVLLVDGNCLHVEHLFVLPSVRRRGVARAMLVVATSIAERSGADQVMAGAPPAARDTHRFLARLGFSPLMVRRVVGTATLRRRLAGEGQRRGLDDLLSRRRSLRARSLRAGWGGGPLDEPVAGEDPLSAEDEFAAPPVAHGVSPDDGDHALAGLGEDGAVPRIDLSDAADAACPLPPLAVGQSLVTPTALRGRARRSRGAVRG
jgi:GNAT superfamily N-acetyltransferase